jgi:ADP-heptose:LPS heptosyltransferase
LIKNLRAIDFDLLVDFKDTMLPFLLYAKRKTINLRKPPCYIKHMRDRHLWRLKQAVPELLSKDYKPNICISDEILAEIDEIFRSEGISAADKIVAVAPGSRSHTKQWTKEGFLCVCRRLISELKVKVVLVGDKQDVPLCCDIAKNLGSDLIDLCAKTTLKQLAGILKRSALLITNDSAPMHIAWAVGTSVVAIFGPTNHEKYRPLGPKDIVIRRPLACSPCQQALCKADNECMKQVTDDEIFQAARSILEL